jgi:lysozyme family protein
LLSPGDLKETAISNVLGAEGVHNVDQGGDTWFGIARRFHPEISPWPPSRGQAHDFYSQLWESSQCSGLPPALALALFDAMVNHGVVWAIEQLQEQLGVAIDGIVGPGTIAAARESNVGETLDMFLARRAVWYAHDPEGQRLGLMARLFRLQREVFTEAS